MSKKRIIAIIVLLVIIIGAIVLLLMPKEKKVITEEDYKENPKYILEELMVSNGVYIKLPKVKKAWGYSYEEKSCIISGALEVSEKGYNSIIDQLDNDMKVDRYEEGEFKDENMRNVPLVYVEENPRLEPLDGRTTKENQCIVQDDAEITYYFRVPDCQYQTYWNGKNVMGIFMVKEYSKYYMMFVCKPEFKW